MKKTKTLKSMAVMLAFALLLGGCGNGGGETTEAPAESAESTEAVSQAEGSEQGDAQPTTGEGKVIEVVAKGFQHQFWKAVYQGAQQAADQYGATMTFQGPKNETAIQEQVQMLANAINKKPDAVALAALDTKASLDLLNQAKDANIPVIGFDSGIPDAPEGLVVATAATDNEAAAAIGAEKMFEALKSKMEAAAEGQPVRIGVVSQEVNSASISGRTKGFIDKYVELSKALPNVGDKVAVVGNDKFKAGDEATAVVVIDLAVPAQVTDAEGQTQAQTLLNKQDLIGIFGSNEFGAKAIINANNALGGVVGEGKIVAVGFDSGKIQIDAIKNKTLFGSVTQDPVSIGFNAVEMAIKASNGETVEDVDTGAVWYDSTNVDSEEVKPLLYE
ncbi:MAG: substrate-binding domain-containing protein [Peptoniphilaceae bacterium]|nr:substrate-binding domain-containing protein [Peptoniphilaceae bacterium]MDY6085647.1 substrate-binding domain-containing protein [Peptoniphilaceae bacterium]